MKRTIISIVSMVLFGALCAQAQAQSLPLTAGLLGHAGWHPGFRVGTQLSLKQWASPATEGARTRSLQLSPQLGAYVYPNVHTGYLATVDLGLKHSGPDSRCYWTVAVGLGYLGQAQLTDVQVSLGDGKTRKQRDHRSWLLSTLSGEYGRPINARWGWYTKLSAGYRISTVHETAVVLLAELGTFLHLQKRT